MTRHINRLHGIGDVLLASDKEYYVNSWGNGDGLRPGQGGADVVCRWVGIYTL